MWCKHDWEVVTHERQKASLADMRDRFKSGRADHLKDTYILVMKCKKCGKIDKTIKKV